MKLRALTWNLFHGRDFPPDPSLFTWRSRFLGLSERNATHLQVNRELFDEFAGVLAAADWEVALLQECPPRWSQALARACDAEAHRALTSRNSLAAIRGVVARLNPDLIASNEGGSNLTLIRAAAIIERRELELRSGPEPERRAMAFTRIAPAAEEPICVANLHASAGRALRTLAEGEVLLAAERACDWAGGDRLILGGDLNLRPRETTVYAELEQRFGLAPPTAPGALDHLLASGLEVLEPPSPWPPERREIERDGLRVRLSDHAPVAAAFG